MAEKDTISIAGLFECLDNVSVYNSIIDITRPINADNLQLCLSVLKKISTLKQSCKFPVIGDVQAVEKPSNLTNIW